MILQCPISGQYWNSSGLSAISMTASHPIFNLRFEQLKLIYNKAYLTGKLEADNDIRLLALAILNSSGLVTWADAAQADFDLTIAHTNLPELISSISFILDDARPRQQILTTFASLVISNEASNTDMTIIPSICAEWHQNSLDYFGNIAETRRLEANKQALESLRRLLATSYKNPARYITHLATWVIKSLDISNDSTITVTAANSHIEHIISLSDYYRYIIEFSGAVEKGAYSYCITEQAINDLLDLMLDKLDYNSQFCFTASNLLRELLAKGHYHNSRGFQAAYLRSSGVSEYLAIDLLPEPDKADYPDFKSYFLAKSKWQSQQSAIANSANNSQNNI